MSGTVKLKQLISLFRKLHDVRGRLDQLRDLVQYYQHSTEFIHGHADSDDTDEDVPPRPEADPIGGERYKLSQPGNTFTCMR